MDVVASTSFASDSSVERVELAVPDLAQPGDVLLATLCAPQHHPDTPWPEPAGWFRELQTVHLAHFTRLVTGQEPMLAMFPVNPELGKAQTPVAVMLLLRDPPNTRPVSMRISSTNASWGRCRAGRSSKAAPGRRQKMACSSVRRPVGGPGCGGFWSV